MNLREKLNQFLFNLETAELLQSLGRTREQITTEMNSLNFSESLLQFQSSSSHLYNSVMLRLRLYSENNFSEQQVRNSLSILNNSYVNSLLDYLYSNNSETVSTPVVTQPVSQPVVVSQPVAQPVVSQPVVAQHHVAQPVVAEIAQSTNQEESEEETLESEDDENPFDSFFDSCVQQTEEPTDIVKGSDFYQAFSEWWETQYEDTVPDKKELKNYLNEKLGKSKKSTWTNVVLSN